MCVYVCVCVCVCGKQLFLWTQKGISYVYVTVKNTKMLRYILKQSCLTRS